MRLRSALILSLIALTLATPTPKHLQLHHRYLSPSGPSDNEWVPLGIIPVDEDMTASTLQQSRIKGDEEIDGSGSGKGDGKEGWYQVGVERDGLWVLASTRACLLTTSPPSLTLHLQSNHLTSLSITPPLSRCLDSTTVLAAPPSLQELKEGSRGWDIQISRARRIDSPSLPLPPSLTSSDPTTGIPKHPEPEKTLLQKYWLPLLGISLFLLGQLGSGAAQATQGEAQGEGGGGVGVGQDGK